MRNKRWLILGLVITCLLMLVVPAGAQQLDQIGKKGGIKVSGGIGVNQSLYFADGVDERFNPYSYMITGNLNFNIYGFSVPLSFRYSNQEVSYGQPLNIIGLSPTYKNLTLHAGFRSMAFSSYTLAGHQFYGGGLEYSYKNLSIAAMGGRLLDAVEYDTAAANIDPVYRRFGTGVKIGYGKGGNKISFITFYGKDDPNSLDSIPPMVDLYPEENQVYSIEIKKKLQKNVDFYFEGARSAWTKDQGSEEISENSVPDHNLYFIPISVSTVFYNAFKTGLKFSLANANVGLNFERVDPEYRTLGAYYFNSDFQNFTGSFSRNFFNKKLSLSANVGLQRDDLNNEKASRMDRFVGSVNSSLTLSKKFNASFGYSNFNSTINVKPLDQAFVENSIYENMDTMNYVQVNQTFTGSMNYRPLESSNVSHSIAWNANYNTTSNTTGSTETATDMMGTSLSYNVRLKKSGVSLGINANGNQNNYETGSSNFLGFGANASTKLLNKKLRASLNARYTNNYEGGTHTASLYSLTNSYSLKVKKKHSFSLSLRYSGRLSKSTSEYSYYKDTFNEFFGSLGYNFRF